MPHPACDKHCARTGRRNFGRVRRPLAAARPSPLFSQEFVEHLDVHRLVGDKALEPTILLFHLPESLRFAHLQPAVLPLSAIVRGTRDLVLPAEFRDRCSGVTLTQNRDDLLVREPALSHPVLLSGTDIITGSAFGEQISIDHRSRRPARTEDGQGGELSYCVSVLMENRRGLLADAEARYATEHPVDARQSTVAELPKKPDGLRPTESLLDPLPLPQTLCVRACSLLLPEVNHLFRNTL